MVLILLRPLDRSDVWRPPSAGGLRWFSMSPMTRLLYVTDDTFSKKFG
jgi:hypothetical protein